MLNTPILRWSFKRQRKLLRLSEPSISPCTCSNCELIAEEGKKMFSATVLFGSILIALFLMISSCKVAHAAVTESDAVKILVGEASNQGLKGMICVAEVLRKQGSTRGFYGLKAKHSNREPKWVWEQAKKAWLASANTNYTKNADHFENIDAFGCPSWVKSCVEVFRYKDHVFYKEARS